MIGDKYWHEYLINIVAFLAGCNLCQTFFDLCSCGPKMVGILTVNLVLSLALMSYIYHLAEGMDMQNDNS